MNNPVRVILFLVICSLLIACGQAVTASPTPSETKAPTITPSPSQTPTATVEPTPRPTYVRPTFIPTIDPALLPALFESSFSIQSNNINGYKIRRITGWGYGYGGGYCSGYEWLDSNHLIFYPRVGQVPWGDGQVAYLASQPVINTIDTGDFWLPPSNKSESPFNCRQLDWSQELKALITTEISGDISTVSTYTYDGKKLASYPGKVLDASPSGTKVLIADNILIDLRTGEKISLNWNFEDYYEPLLSSLFWTSDETRAYRCCYFYADIATGISHRFKRSDFQTVNGNHLDDRGLWFHSGFWVRGDRYFLVWWQVVDDGDIKYLPLFDPATKTFYDVRELAGIPESFSSNYTPVSPDGNYVWMEGWNESYLVNLTTFESQHFTYSNPTSYTDIDWSSDSKFTWFEIYDSDAQTTEFNILSIATMKLHPFTDIPQTESEHLWHPNKNIVVFPAKDKNALVFLDASTMSIRELPFQNQEQLYKISDLTWSPNGEKLAFVTDNSALWLVDYPALEYLEHILSALSITSVKWSPDGKTIAFVSTSDIYMVEPNNTTP